MKRLLFLALIVPLAYASMAQVFSDDFGKNRIQYHDRFENWSYYESDHFVSYWYGNGRNVAQQAALLAEKEIADVERIIEYRIANKIDLVIYNDLTDLHQSNIGSEKAVTTSNSRFKTLDNKIFVYNDGNAESLRVQIREGIAAILVNYTLYGESLKEIVKNSLFEDLPSWFKPGLIAYCGERWTVERDNNIKAFFQLEENADFDDLHSLNPEFCGHSFWYFVSTVYGEGVISDILYLIRVNGDVNNAFQYVLDTDNQGLFNNWRQFYTDRMPTGRELAFEPLNLKIGHDQVITHSKWSHDGLNLAYVTEEQGKKRVFVYSRKEGKSQRIFKTGLINKLQISDLNYPLIDWSPDDNVLVMVYEKADQVSLKTWDKTTGKLSPTSPFAPQIERVISIDHFSQTEVVVSGIQRGYSDLYFYNLSSGQLRRITRNFYYESNVQTGKLLGNKGIFYSGNRYSVLYEDPRLDSVWSDKALNAFFYDLEEKKHIRLSDFPVGQVSNIYPKDSTMVFFIADQSGVNNLYQSPIKPYLSHYTDSIIYKSGEIKVISPSVSNSYDSTKIESLIRNEEYAWKGDPRVISNFSYKLVDLQQQDNSVFITLDKGSSRLFYILNEEEFLTILGQANTSHFMRSQKAELEFDNARIEEIKAAKKLPEEDKEKKEPEGGFYFQSIFDDQESNAIEPANLEDNVAEVDSVILDTLSKIVINDTIAEDQALRPWFSDRLVNYYDSISGNLMIEDELNFKPSEIIPYRLKFKVYEFKTDLENQPLVTGMETFLTGENNDFVTPIGLTLRAGAKDLLEDYIVEGALRLPTSLNGIEYYLSYHDNKRQLDKRYIFYRRSRNETTAVSGRVDQKNKLINTGFIYQLKYPLNIFSSLRLTSYLREDKFIYRSTRDATLNEPTTREQRLGVRLEFVYDNTYDIDLNLLGGSRYRVFVEGIKSFSFDYGTDWSLSTGEGINYLIGADYRWYKPVLKHSVFAVRAVSALSFGAEKVLFYLGGSRNWVLPKFDSSIPLPQDQFSFYSLATNVRGFNLNTRNGTSFALTNVELRVPVLKYLYRKPIKSDFFRSLQLVGFFDAGKTWNGLNPLDNSQAQSTVTIQNDDYVRLEVSFFRDQLLMSYGGGLRAKVFGYFVRLDCGQGIESGELLDNRLWHLSLGTDF